MGHSRKYFKNSPSDTIWWIDNSQETVGEFIFTFNKKDCFNLFADYPYKLTEEQKRIFDKENPYWADFFKYR